MSAFMSYLMSILAVVIVGTILDIFLSEKKLGKTIRGVVASLIVLIIITPIPSLLNTNISCQNIFSESEISLDYSYLEYANSTKTRALEQGLIKAYEEKGYKNISVSISAVIDKQIKINWVKITIADLSLDNPSLSINKIEKITQLAQDFLNIKREIISIYE